MKKLLLMLLLCLPLLASAQTEPKYLAGAVTMNEGKVSFQKEFQAPSLSKQEIYDVLLKWGQQRFQPKDDFHARVLYSNEAEGSIAIGGEEYLVFSSTALSLDRTRIYYQLYLTCQDGQVNAEMTRIRYWYDEQRDGGQHYKAEEWINDKMALNKSQTKLAPICGKFRRETIDLKDELFKQIHDELAKTVLTNTQLANHVQPAAQPTATAQPAHPATTGEKVVVIVPTPETLQAGVAGQAVVGQAVVGQASVGQTVAGQAVVAAQHTVPAQTANASTQTANASAQTVIPAARLTPAQPVDRDAHIQASARITLTASGEQLSLGKESWGGFGQLFGKEVVFCLLNQNKKLGNLLLEQSETYTVAFYDEGQSEPWLTVHCKKMMKQEVSGEEAQKMNASSNSSQSYNLYVGEVVK